MTRTRSRRRSRYRPAGVRRPASPRRHVRPGLALAGLALLLVAATSCGSDSSTASGATTSTAASGTSTTAAASGVGKLVGTFKITAGACASGAPTGSYFRMVNANGTLAAGPFVPNADSTCGDKSYTAVEPGTDGGLTTGTFQDAPKIIQAAKFFAAPFSLSTAATDAQTKVAVSAPTITAGADGTLTGDLRAISIAWNGQFFNQGSPKPDGSTPGITKAVSGTYDQATGAYTLEWASQVVGGPFNGFTGTWHLEGTFTKS